MAAEVMAENLYAKAYGKAKSTSEKRRKTLNASENEVVSTEAIEETPPQDTTAMICRLI